jgi:subfamily B ATP-binding cassette protein HlyB/CyaB
VLVIGLLVVWCSRVVLSGLRTYRLQPHHQPHRRGAGRAPVPPPAQPALAYFQARRVGDSVARVRELENIRSLPHRQGLTVVLDVLFSVVFIAVMLFYSGWLTAGGAG